MLLTHWAARGQRCDPATVPEFAAVLFSDARRMSAEGLARAPTRNKPGKRLGEKRHHAKFVPRAGPELNGKDSTSAVKWSVFTQQHK